MKKIKTEIVSKDESYDLKDDEKIIGMFHHRSEHNDDGEFYVIEYVYLVIECFYTDEEKKERD